MRALAALAVAIALGGCVALPLPGPDALGHAAPVEEGPPVPVARSGDAHGLLVHVHAWRSASPATEGVHYVILDVSVRRVTPDAPTVTTGSFSVRTTAAGAPGSVVPVDPLLTKLLPRALPPAVTPPVNVTVRGDVLATLPPGHAPSSLEHEGARVVDVATRGEDAPPRVALTPGRLAPGTEAGGEQFRVRVFDLALADAHAQHATHRVLAIDHAYAAARVEDARGVSLGFLLRGADGRLYAPSVSETPEWWDGTSGRAFEPERAYRDAAWMEAPATAPPFEVWYARDAGAPLVWGPFTPNGTEAA